MIDPKFGPSRAFDLEFVKSTQWNLERSIDIELKRSIQVIESEGGPAGQVQIIQGELSFALHAPFISLQRQLFQIEVQPFLEQLRVQPQQLQLHDHRIDLLTEHFERSDFTRADVEALPDSEGPLGIAKNVYNFLYANNITPKDINDYLEHLENLSSLITLGVAETNVSAEGVDRLRKALPRCDIQTDR